MTGELKKIMIRLVLENDIDFILMSLIEMT